jgi:hypothetical protein
MPVDIDGGGVTELNAVIVALQRVGAWAAQTAVDIQDVPVVGKALSMPFVTLSQRIGAVTLNLTYFLIAFQRMVDAIKVGDLGGSIEAALDMLFPAWRRLKADPLGFIVDTLADSYSHVPLLLRDPNAWLIAILTSLQPTLADFVQDPLAWLESHMPEMPEGWGAILADPIGWLKGVLSEIWGVDLSFWDDPLGNIVKAILDWIVAHLIEFAKWVYPVAEKVIRYLWEGEL